MADRSLRVIAAEIRKDWKPVHYTAAPYLGAMFSVETLSSKYGADDGEDIVAYFLSNAGTWKGETARRIKAELRKMLKAHR